MYHGFQIRIHFLIAAGTAVTLAGIVAMLFAVAYIMLLRIVRQIVKLFR
jgi:chromate transport protein ChrA